MGPKTNRQAWTAPLPVSSTHDLRREAYRGLRSAIRKPQYACRSQESRNRDFDKLDADKDGTLDLKELPGRLSRKDFAAADGDHDKTLDKNEYLALVEQRFKAADADGDGTVNAAEFGTPAGRALLRLLD